MTLGWPPNLLKDTNTLADVMITTYLHPVRVAGLVVLQPRSSREDSKCRNDFSDCGARTVVVITTGIRNPARATVIPSSIVSSNTRRLGVSVRNSAFAVALSEAKRRRAPQCHRSASPPTPPQVASGDERARGSEGGMGMRLTRGSFTGVTFD